MMEGALSLMQMAKICGALARLDRARLPYIAVLTDPTTGGVTASFAMLGDLNIAEPKALIGFAGPRVIEQTIRQKLPEGFQRSEFLLEKGMLDLVVDRREMKALIASALRFMGATARPARAGRRSRWPRDRRQPEPAAQSATWPTIRSTIFQPRAVRHQVRPRQHRARSSTRSAIPSARSGRSTSPAPTARARSPRWSTRRCAPPGIDRPLHLAASGRSDRAVRRSTAGRSTGPTLECGGRATVRDAVDGCRRAACCDASRPSSKSRRRRRSSSSGAPGSRSRSAKSGSAAGSTRPTSSTPMVTRDHLDRARPPAVPRAHAGGDRAREGRHHQAGRAGGRRAARRRRRVIEVVDETRRRHALERATTSFGADADARQRLQLRPLRDYGASAALPATSGRQRGGRGAHPRAARPSRRVACPRRPSRPGLEQVAWPGRLERRRLPRRTRSAARRRAQPRRRAGAAALSRAARRRDRWCSPPCATRTRPGCSSARAGRERVRRDARVEPRRSSDPAALAELARRDRSEPHDRRRAARPVDALAQHGVSRRIVVAGSIFLLGDVMKELVGRDTLGPCAPVWMLARSDRRR